MDSDLAEVLPEAGLEEITGAFRQQPAATAQRLELGFQRWSDLGCGRGFGFGLKFFVFVLFIRATETGTLQAITIAFKPSWRSRCRFGQLHAHHPIRDLIRFALVLVVRRADD
jgi:hypothetical protein